MKRGPSRKKLDKGFRDPFPSLRKTNDTSKYIDKALQDFTSKEEQPLENQLIGVVIECLTQKEYKPKEYHVTNDEKIARVILSESETDGVLVTFISLDDGTLDIIWSYAALVFLYEELPNAESGTKSS